ncbi:hypothetical protein SAMN04488239_12523 [Ruegeria marina]|uniref:Uncharacterized protein n=1 Tax=Ruegeria marina TaxID=639004 RepID=A0A1G7EES3_9RHOB|nr:hypothetical protein SAMN04488239_12523 [Ruegeria marina]
MNQCAFRHSARGLLPNGSVKPLSVGFPSQEKSRVTSLAWAQRSRSRAMKSLPLSTLIVLRYDQPILVRCPSSEWGQICLHRGFVNEDNALGLCRHRRDTVPEPCLALLPYLDSTAFGGHIMAIGHDLALIGINMLPNVWISFLSPPVGRTGMVSITAARQRYCELAVASSALLGRTILLTSPAI